MAKVSVIIPCYNVENYIKECLDSVINQTLKDIEIICVNDGSTDSTLNILMEYKQKDSRITVINKNNEGAAIARNIGIEKASGEYLSILDSDDIFELNMLELMYEQAKKTDSDITICRSKILNMRNNKIEDMSWSLNYLPQKKIFSYKDLLPYHVFDFCIGWSWDKLYKKTFVENHNFRFQNIRSTNDAYFVFMSICLAEKITTVNNMLVSHRMNTGSQLSETREKDPLCFIKACRKIKNDLIDIGLYKDVKQSFLNWFVHFTWWQIKSLPLKYGNLIQKDLIDIFEEFDCLNKNEKFYLNKQEYKLLKKLKNNPNYNILKELQCPEYKFIEKIFSIKNQYDKNNKYKILTILGINIKLRGNNE